MRTVCSCFEAVVHVRRDRARDTGLVQDCVSPGVRSFGSEIGERTETNPCSASSEKEHGRTQVRSLDSELGERFGPNPGSAGSENLPNSEPAKPGLYPVLSLNFGPPNQG